VHTVDVIVVCTAVVIVVLFAGILARQRYMLRTTGAVPLAMQRGNRWLYGIGRYRGGELRFYRALGVGTHPTRVLRRGHVQVLGRRAPLESERGSLPATAVIIECRADGETVAFAIGESAFTGFVSWLESSAPL
jgi:Protein of unknown function (DUF2550)